MSHHHPDEARLLDFSAGNLSEPQALSVRLHLNQCPRCRCQADMMDSIGAVFLDRQEQAATGTELSDGLFEHILERIETGSGTTAPPRQPATDPLRKLLGRDFDQLPWKRQLGAVSVLDITDLFADQSEQIVLQKLNAGGRAPRHTHRGVETTVVVTGAFTDNRGVFEVGDFVVLDQEVDHQPVALQGDDCITFSILSAPVRLTGPLLRMLNPFIS